MQEEIREFIFKKIIIFYATFVTLNVSNNDYFRFFRTERSYDLNNIMDKLTNATNLIYSTSIKCSEVKYWGI